MSLSEYRRKRDFKATSEPRGRKRRSKGADSYLIQKHAAQDVADPGLERCPDQQGFLAKARHLVSLPRSGTVMAALSVTALCCGAIVNGDYCHNSS